MNDLAKKYRPKSDDPDFWSVWTGASAREENWAGIVDEWQGGNILDAEIVSAVQEVEEPEQAPPVNLSSEDEDDLPF